MYNNGYMYFPHGDTFQNYGVLTVSYGDTLPPTVTLYSIPN